MMNSTQQLDGMPTELLEQIFGHFAEPQLKDLQTLDNWKQGHNSPWRECRSALQNLRLVCRRFHDLTSPLLFTYLFISVEQGSVEKADKISRQPHLASCIRGVIIHAGLYDLGMLDSLHRHRNRITSELGYFLGSLIQQRRYPNNCETVPDRAKLKAMVRNYRNIVLEWKQEADVGDLGRLNAEVDEEFCETDILDSQQESGTLYLEAPPYRKILEDGYEMLKACTTQARQYLKTGAFASDLVACLVRLPHLETVEMDAQRRALMDPRDVLEGNVPEALGHFVESGLHGAWKSPDSFRDGHFAPIMTTLLARLHDAGIRLRALRLSMFPFAPPLPDHRTIDAYRLPGHEASMKRLTEATKTLESVTINMYFETHPYWKEFADDYVRAVLGSPALHELEMFVPLPAKAFGREALATTACRVGQLLSARSPERLRRVRLTGLMLQEATLESILIRCSHVWLDGVYLRDGLWANVVDKVMAKRSSDKRLDRHKIHLRHIKGGEMGHILLHEQVTAPKEQEYENMGYGGTEPVVLLMAEEYLKGNGKVQRNPFREHKGNASYFRCRTPKVRS